MKLPGRLLPLVFLTGCSWQGSFGPSPSPAPPLVIPGFVPVQLPGGAVVEEPVVPARAPIETVITGLTQAQQVRTLARQLAH